MVAFLVIVAGDARKLRLHVDADDLLIVDADDGDLLRHAEIGLTASVEDLAGAIVGNGEQANGLRQAHEPVFELALLIAPRQAFRAVGRRHEERGCVQAGIMNSRGEGVLADGRVGDAVEAVEGEGFEAAFEEMLGGESPHEAVVEADARHGGFRQRAGDVDHGCFELFDAGGFARCVERGDDAGAAPAPKVEHRHGERLGRGEIRPIAVVFERVAEHAGDEHFLVRAAGEGQGDFFTAFGGHN